ncbi:hypothetical protein FB567DRAFT_501916 [Paraphoma chrysanthemicola]|uniref:DUF2293 domain-containing protein n=1 Tax=Paraphoma chrysanthemicola TaxID=798071 RepID=A0A8K0QYE9_9PLEO|nr:hypothetical protein FB567DRAFT_501916 [Paraphoma chrysanthemicola]
MPTDIPVSPTTPMPPGYTFLPAGTAYKTLHTRKLTRASSQPLYIVIQHKKPLGLRAPINIVEDVHHLAEETLSTRRSNTKKKDVADLTKAGACLDELFPRIPTGDRERVLDHGFKKHSGRVGRTGSIPLERKAVLAVLAHVRHSHSEYDKLLRGGMDREDARRMVRKDVESIARGWGFTGELGGKKVRTTKTKEKSKGKGKTKGKGKKELKSRRNMKEKTRKMKAQERKESSSPDLFDCDDSMDEDYVP